MADVKPDIKDEKPDVNKLEIKVVYESREFRFKLKKSTPFKKVFENVESQVGATTGTLRFFCNEHRLRPQQTLADLDLDDDEEDILFEATVEQIGGSA